MDFEKQFATEEACRDYLAHIRWPKGIQCSRCQSRELWPMSRLLYLCKKCRFQTSVLTGTLFQDTKKPLRLWFRAMWYITNQKSGASALGVQRILGLGSYYTAWKWLHKLRKVMVRVGRDKLSGSVEVDETYIGGSREGKRGRGAAGKALVLVAAERNGRHVGRIRLKRVADASAENLTQAVKENIEPKSRVLTDGWTGYSSLGHLGYRHRVVRQNFSIGENPLPLVHRVVSLLKRWILGTHQGAVATPYLDYYLDEFTFRFNRRNSQHRGKLFYRLIQQVAETAIC